MAGCSGAASSCSHRTRPLAEIVGIVGDVRHNGLTSEPVPTVFLLHAQTTRLHHEPRRSHDWRSERPRRGPPAGDSRGRSDAGGVGGRHAGAGSWRRAGKAALHAVLVTGFAAIAVILAIIGVYGLIAYVVTQRTHEIGIRLALGATGRRVFVDLFGQGARLVIAGLAVGRRAVGLRGVLPHSSSASLPAIR